MTAGASRKYTTEFHLVLPVIVRALGRQPDLLAADVSEFTDCHIYIVSRTPHFTAHPDAVVVDGTHVTLTVRAQIEDNFDEVTISVPHEFGEGAASWKSEWPYEEYELIDRDGATLTRGVVGLLAGITHEWPDRWRQHEVLYVGQAFGAEGERSAWDRLQSHGTVQRILGDNPRDKQVWIALASIDDVNMQQEISPDPATVSEAEDEAHTATVLEAFYSGELVDRDSVALAEAGLIRAFQPEYNDRLKYNFPARKQVPLETARRLDLNQLFIELQAQYIGVAYFSQAVANTRPIRFFEYSIHMDSDRSGLLGLDRQQDDGA